MSIGLGTVRDFRHPLGTWEVSLSDKGVYWILKLIFHNMFMVSFGVAGTGEILTSKTGPFHLTNGQGSQLSRSISACALWLWWVETQDVSAGAWGVLSLPHEAPLSFFKQKQHHVPLPPVGLTALDSTDCFPTLPCLFLFIWLLYFRDLQSLFWQG